MSDIAIRVENLGKRYRIGMVQEGAFRYRTLRDAVMNVLGSPLGRLRSPGGSARDREENTFWALRDVSLDVKHGDIVGIIGRNGAGKTTLLKILSRITEPTEGSVTLEGRVGSLLEVGTGFHPELTGRENIYLNGAILGMRRYEIDRKFDEIVAFAEVEKFLDTPVKHYSSGMYVRLAFSVAAHLEPEILLVDEVLAVGDAAFQKKCLGKMGNVASEGRTVLFVSHNMSAVQQLCHYGIMLTGGEISVHGSIEKVVGSYLHSVRTIVSGTDLTERVDRKGSQWLRFTRVVVYDSEGNELRQVTSGQDVTIRFCYESSLEKRNASVMIAFNVRSSQGYPIANLNSVDTGCDMLDIHSRGHFECRWPKLNLRSGDYDCNLFCSVGGEIVDWIQNAFFIHVEDGNYYGTGKLTDRTQGDILIDHTWACGQPSSKEALE